MCLILFVAVSVSFPEHKALVNNLGNFISMFKVPLLLRYAVKDQKNTRQLCKNNEVVTYDSVMKANGAIKKVSGVVKNHNQLQEMVSIVNQSTVKFSKRSESRSKNGEGKHPDLIIVEGVEKIIVKDSDAQSK